MTDLRAMCGMARGSRLGEALSMIGDLLGHRMMNATARNAHLARDSVRETRVCRAVRNRCTTVRNAELPRLTRNAFA